MTLRHDAHQCRQSAKSERIRREHGWLTPEEVVAQLVAEKKRQQDQARKAAAGQALFQEGL
jgi:uncharacterized Fe-S cluster-containing radical SAM superfamily protein